MTTNPAITEETIQLARARCPHPHPSYHRYIVTMWIVPIMAPPHYLIWTHNGTVPRSAEQTPRIEFMCRLIRYHGVSFYAWVYNGTVYY